MRDRRLILRHAVISLGFLLVYLPLNLPEVIVIARLGLVAWYPALGVALALMLAVSVWYIPLMWLANVLAAFVFYRQPLTSFGQTIGAAASALSYGGAAYVLRGPLRIDFRLGRRSDVVRYLFVSSAAAVLSALVASACLAADGSIAWNEYWRTAAGWFLGDGIGFIGIAPFLLLYVFPHLRHWLAPDTVSESANANSQGMDLRFVLEACAQAIAILAVLWLMFAPQWGHYEYLFLSFIPIIWIAIRQGIQRSVVALVALNFGIVIALRVVPPTATLLMQITVLMLVLSAVGLVVGSEVSERYRMAIDLNQRTTYLDSLIQHSPFGIVVFDRQARVELVNAAFEKLFPPANGGPHSRAPSLPDGTPAEFLQDLSQVLAGHPVHRTVRWPRHDGTVLDLSLHSVPLVVNGELRGAYTLCEDVSQQVKAAADQAQLVNELEVRATQMTLLNEMGGRLECCITLKEACTVISQSLQKLFPEARSGTLYLFRPSRKAVEAATFWGDISISDPLFAPDTCCSLQQGQPHWSGDPAGSIGCRHVRESSLAKTLCAPLSVPGETVGVLHLEFSKTHSASDAEDLKASQEGLAITVSGQIARSLASLRLREALREQSIRDPLTGLYNRRFMEEALGRELHRADRRKYSVSLLFFDLDHFKRFNDSFGHDAGDVVLRAIGELTRSFFRASDICCRYGGEEFAIILPEMPAEIAAVRSNVLREEVKQLDLCHLGKPLGAVTISVGIAAFPDNGATADELFRMADHSLYESKAGGRDRVTVAAAKSCTPA